MLLYLLLWFIYNNHFWISFLFLFRYHRTSRGLWRLGQLWQEWSCWEEKTNNAHWCWVSDYSQHDIVLYKNLNQHVLIYNLHIFDSGNELGCTLWGSYAQQFSDFLNTCSDHGKIIAILQLAMMKIWDGNLTTFFSFIFFIIIINCWNSLFKNLFARCISLKALFFLMDRKNVCAEWL